jgi:hypothetical protein
MMNKVQKQSINMAGKKEVSMNMNINLWRKARIAAAERDITLTRAVEHFLEDGMNSCKHYEIK